ncbi:MAG TPA: hypothetical protein VFX48_07050, partial [Saprospiraceae bacterium]|nr:hypothetical protein [Saprospiraceae bacterium]
MHKLLGLSFFLLASGLQAQNLIPNPGFEQCDLCDSRGVKELGIGSGANMPPDWNAATFGTPDFQSVTPRSGKRHGGFFTGFGKFEYLANHFSEPLTAGARYRFSFWIRPATNGSNNFAVDEMGVFFQKGMPDYRQAEPLKQLVPHFSTPDQQHLQGEYQLIRFEYTACGGEDHFIVGRFRALDSGDTTFIGTKRPVNPATEAIYYFVDDFEMIALEPPVVVDLLPETIVLCPDEIKFIRIPAPYDQGNILWSNGKTLPEIDVPRSPW